MIDYKKLKIAFELTQKYAIESREFQRICIGFNSDSQIQYDIYGRAALYNDIDALIAKLQELTKSKPKYEVGQEVWLVGNFGKPIKAEIVGKMGGDVDLAFEDGTCRYGAVSELYPSKKELIEAQIEYWTKMRDKAATEIFSEERIKKAMIEEIDSMPVYGLSHCKECKKPLYDCEDKCVCHKSLGNLEPEFEGEIKGFGYDGHKILDKCKKCRELYR